MVLEMVHQMELVTMELLLAYNLGVAWGNG
jgi:hypothetical protein